MLVFSSAFTTNLLLNTHTQSLTQNEFLTTMLMHIFKIIVNFFFHCFISKRDRFEWIHNIFYIIYT